MCFPSLDEKKKVRMLITSHKFETEHQQRK